MSVFDAMMQARVTAHVDHFTNDIVADMEFVLHPDTFADLRKDPDAKGQFLQQRSQDGVYEFFNTPIRLDDQQDGWALKMVSAE